MPDKATAIAQAEQTAALIAAKSPVAVQGTKAIVEYSRDHAIEDGGYSLSSPLRQPLIQLFTGLQYTAVWNAAMLQTSDVTRAMEAGRTRKKPTFERL